MLKKNGKKFSFTTGPAPYRAPALSKIVRDEPDKKWKQWFINIEERRRTQNDSSKTPVKMSFCKKEGEKDVVIARRQSQPLRLNTLLKTGNKKRGERLAEDFDIIKTVWLKTVDAETAGETEIYSFNRGILTITVGSSILLQELRQFHKDAIMRDLQDIWTASTPLVDIKYRLGKLNV